MWQARWVPEPPDLVSFFTLVIALLTVIVSAATARKGWVKEQRRRDDALIAECITELSDLIHARIGPLFSLEWNQRDAVFATKHHIAAIAAMQGVSEGRRDLDMVRFFADQSALLQGESVRYRRSDEASEDRSANLFGKRRSAIVDSALWMQQDLLLWQRQIITTSAIRSFYWRYASQLLSLAADNPKGQ